MNSVKFGCLLSSVFLLSCVSPAAHADDLNGYKPPQMFGGSSASKPVAPTLTAPAAEPVQATPQQIITAPVAPKAAPATAIRAEDLLNHAVTGVNALPEIQKNPMAVPAPAVEKGLPLPGSVAPQPKINPAVAASKTLDRPADKKPEKKAEPKKEPVKKAPPKKETKPEIKPVAKPVAKPAVKPVPEVKKAEPKKEIVKPAPTLPLPEPKVETKAPAKAEIKSPPATIPDLPVPHKTVPDKIEPVAKPYHPDGRKNMPVVNSSKVEKSTEMKSPLPKLEPIPPEAAPTPNEKIIDKALEDHLVEPDLKAIIKPNSAPVAPKEKTAAPGGVFKPELIGLEFGPGVTDIQSDQKNTVDGAILPKMAKDKRSRLQILAYASAAKEGQSSARRISLARGLSLRSYLLEKGVEPSRIDIRALGDNTNEKPIDRVDLLILDSK